MMEIINQSCANHFEKYCLKMNPPKLCFGNLRRTKICTINLEECTEEECLSKVSDLKK